MFYSCFRSFPNKSINAAGSLATQFGSLLHNIYLCKTKVYKAQQAGSKYFLVLNYYFIFFFREQIDYNKVNLAESDSFLYSHHLTLCLCYWFKKGNLYTVPNSKCFSSLEEEKNKRELVLYYCIHLYP